MYTHTGKSRGFTQSLKFVLGGLSIVFRKTRKSFFLLGDGLHDSPRQDGMPLGERVNSSAGFTILLAALVSSLVLSIGISIFTIARKSIVLSTLGRDSQYAFYAADSAAECALYWDGPDRDAFNTTTPMTEIRCDDPDPPNPIQVTNNLPTWPGTVFEIGVGGQFEMNGNCVEVRVTKNDVPPFTVIRADGYSVPCSVKDTNPRTLQRSVELSS